MPRPFDSETGKAASRLGVEARARKRAERAGLEDDPRKILDRIEWHSKEIVRLTTKLARMKLGPAPAPAVPSSPVPVLPSTADKPAPSNGNAVAPTYDPEAVRRRADEMAKRLNPSAAVEPASTNGVAVAAAASKPASAPPRKSDASQYIEELEAHAAQRRQVDDVAREKEERRARAIESRLRRW
jgi:hypothetical protein